MTKTFLRGLAFGIIATLAICLLGFGLAFQRAREANQQSIEIEARDRAISQEATNDSAAASAVDSASGTTLMMKVDEGQ